MLAVNWIVKTCQVCSENLSAFGITTMDMQEVLALFDKEQRIEIEYPGARKEVLPHVVRFVRPSPGKNFILHSRLNETNVDAAIQEQVAYFTQMDQPFEWKVYDYDTPPDLKDRLVASGFQPDDDPDAVMVLDLQEAPPALLEPILVDVRRLTRRDQLDDIVRVEGQVLGGNFDWLKQHLGDHLEIPGYVSVYAAYVDSQPACTGWVYFHPYSQFAGLFGGATLSDHRRRGLYTAVVAIRAQEATQRGYRFLTTGASPMSHPVLAKHGFRLLTYAHAYEWKGNR